jgi:aspartate aminotransferase
MVDAFHSRRDLVVGLLKEIPGIKINVPEGAFMYSQTYLRSSENIKRNFNKDANDFAMYLLGKM